MAPQMLALDQADLPECFDLAYRSLHENNGPWALVFPNGVTPADRDHWVEKQIKRWPTSPSEIRSWSFKAVNTDRPAGKQIVGLARWFLYPNADSLATEFASLPPPQPSDYSPSMNVAYRQAMIQSVFQTKLAVMGGQAFLYLQVLAVHPDAQRQGIGAMMVQWGTDKADQLGIPAYLEASSAGRRAYEKAGYEVIREVLPAGGWGNEDSALHYLMLRPARKTSQQ